MRSWGLLLGLCGMGIVGSLAACASEELEEDIDELGSEVKRTPRQVQMNDVSILFPVAKNEKEKAAYLRASTKIAGGVILPANLYTSETGQPMERTKLPPVGAPNETPYNELHVTAMRLDPCFASLSANPKESACENQLRLILQPGTGQDSAVHVFYTITRAELVEAVTEIIALRNASTTADLGPLNVHPLMKKEGLLGPTATGIHELIKRYASEKNLSKFTVFSARDNFNWDFSSHAVKDGQATRETIVTTDASTQNFFVGFGQKPQGIFSPPTKHIDNVTLLLNETNWNAASTTARKKAADAALRVLNPGKHSPNTIDCASCHVAEPGLAERAPTAFSAKNINRFVADKRWINAYVMRRMQTSRTEGNNFHIFSYKNDVARISTRAINETAGVVAYLNENYFKTAK